MLYNLLTKSWKERNIMTWTIINWLMPLNQLSFCLQKQKISANFKVESVTQNYLTFYEIIQNMQLLTKE